MKDEWEKLGLRIRFDRGLGCDSLFSQPGSPRMKLHSKAALGRRVANSVREHRRAAGGLDE
jgi:hypothetical protein